MTTPALASLLTDLRQLTFVGPHVRHDLPELRERIDAALAEPATSAEQVKEACAIVCDREAAQWDAQNDRVIGNAAHNCAFSIRKILDLSQIAPAINLGNGNFAFEHDQPNADYAVRVEPAGTVSADPWGQFLDARAKCIDWMLSDGKLPDQIAKELSCDAEQILAIAAGSRYV